MIKFFRKIRKKLADDNQFVKYSKYAIGEILLVVIGILIALQVNNWNENRINKIREHRLLDEMTENLKLDMEDVNEILNIYKFKIKSMKSVLNHLNDEDVNKDSLGIYYHSMGGYRIFNSNTSAFNNLQSIGFDLIVVDSLRRQITSLYADKYQRIKYGHEPWDANYQNAHFYPQESAHIFHDNTNWRNSHAFDIEKLKSNRQFKEVLKKNIQMKNRMIFLLEELKVHVVALQKSIENELK